MYKQGHIFFCKWRERTMALLIISGLTHPFTAFKVKICWNMEGDYELFGLLNLTF